MCCILLDHSCLAGFGAGGKEVEAEKAVAVDLRCHMRSERRFTITLACFIRRREPHYSRPGASDALEVLLIEGKRMEHI